MCFGILFIGYSGLLVFYNLHYQIDSLETATAQTINPADRALATAPHEEDLVGLDDGASAATAEQRFLWHLLRDGEQERRPAELRPQVHVGR